MMQSVRVESSFEIRQNAMEIKVPLSANSRHVKVASVLSQQNCTRLCLVFLIRIICIHATDYRCNIAFDEIRYYL